MHKSQATFCKVVSSTYSIIIIIIIIIIITAFSPLRTNHAPVRMHREESTR